ncbi:hypothetical protein [Pseudolysinimonas yzui]|uniref:Uncharacterized protein n=1 Tax=Pseudolysinimonas yzui TaxID=2708254 RepID=A0A8J3GQC4_9MICO|nr:hypothetical protein [Pseudolysinimonas yzui]GHF14661.1 hypothetical protein GCM10011600_14510 [Pseudolysinimonas yzui]
MILNIFVTVLVLGALSWALYWAARRFGPQIPALLALRHASRERIRQNPLDVVRAWVARIAPSRLRSEQRTAKAQGVVEAATGRETRLLTGFPDGVEPSHRRAIFLLAMLVLWIIAICAAALIDLPIVTAVSGGNVLYGVLGTLLALGVPVVCSLLFGDLMLKRRDGMRPVVFSLAVAGLLTAFAAVVFTLTALAPIRAQIEYADEIRATNQQIVQFTEDEDDIALVFAEQKLAELEADQTRSAEWNSALVPIAAGVEFASGFFVPLAIPVVQLRTTRLAKGKAQDKVRKSVDAETRQRAGQYRRLSRAFERAGVTQGDLQRHLALVVAESQVAAPPLNVLEDAPPAGESDVSPAEPPPGAPQDTPRPRENDLVDPTFDAS